MECTNLRDDLLDVLYGEASAKTVRAVEEHCASCAACREELKALRHLRRDLGAWQLPAKAEARPRVYRPWAASLAAALLLAIGGAVGLGLAEVRFTRLLDAREAAFRQELSSMRAEIRAVPARDDQAVLAQMDERIKEAEARQTALLHQRLAGFQDRAEAQRRYDLARMSAGLSYLDTQTGQTMARATQLMGYVIQASEKK